MTARRPERISRRALLRGAGAAGAAAVAAAAAADAATSTGGAAAATVRFPSARQEPPPDVYEQLTSSEAELLEAIADHLIPPDELGPGAVTAGAVTYIDRALGGALAGSRDAYRGGLIALDRYCQASKGGPFRGLPRADQVSVLVDVETGAGAGSGIGFEGGSAFFDMVRTHVLQGTFGDPYYGGNRDFVGWDLIRYPGVRTAVSAGFQTQLEEGVVRPNHRSAYDSPNFEKAVVGQTTTGVHHGD